MTTATPARYQPTAPQAASRVDISQGTAIEQSRAVAEVQAAVTVAQARPRNKNAAVEEMRDATAQTAVAEKAYYRYNRGDGNVTGVTIHLARELARCWGNIDYGVKELKRDDIKGESEMLAHAWDMQTNARASTTFIVPHIRDTSGGARKLTATRDIYENNANAGARRLREQILAVLPNWFVEEAKANCDATLEKGDGSSSVAQRTTAAIYGFGQLGVTQAQLEAKVGRAAAEWTPHDLGQLSVIYQSIKRGETAVAEEFPPQEQDNGDISAEEIAKAGRKRRTAPPPSTSDEGEKQDAPASESSAKPEDSQASELEAPAADEDQAEAAPRTDVPTSEQVGELENALKAEGLRTRKQQLDYLTREFKRPITAVTDLTIEECTALTYFLVTGERGGDGQQALDTEGGAQ